MYTYFKLLHDIAKFDSRDLSIKDITIELATKAGYHRDLFTFKNGKTRIRTLYDNKFDDVLTAKWLCYYEHLFISKLHKHPELKEYHVSIINRTFDLTMRCLQLDKVTTDSVVNKYVNLTIASRIGEAMVYVGSANRIKEKQELGKNRVHVKKAINHMALSLDSLKDSCGFDICKTDSDFSDILIDLNKSLMYNKLGLVLLKSMMMNNCKIIPSHIDDFIDLSNIELNESTRRDLTDAYNLIKKVVANHFGITDKKLIKPIKSVGFSIDCKEG